MVGTLQVKGKVMTCRHKARIRHDSVNLQKASYTSNSFTLASLLLGELNTTHPKIS
jgi:hypothetical protein